MSSLVLMKTNWQQQKLPIQRLAVSICQRPGKAKCFWGHKDSLRVKEEKWKRQQQSLKGLQSVSSEPAHEIYYLLTSFHHLGYNAMTAWRQWREGILPPWCWPRELVSWTSHTSMPYKTINGKCIAICSPPILYIKGSCQFLKSQNHFTSCCCSQSSGNMLVKCCCDSTDCSISPEVGFCLFVWGFFGFVFVF